MYKRVSLFVVYSEVDQSVDSFLVLPLEVPVLIDTSSGSTGFISIASALAVAVARI